MAVPFGRREALAVTVDSVTATCEVITEIPSMLLQPLIHSLLVVVSLLVLVYGLAWILSTGKAGVWLYALLHGL